MDSDISPSKPAGIKHSPFVGLLNNRLAMLALAAALLTTFCLWYLGRQIIVSRAQERFELESRKIESSIGDRLHAYEFFLRGSATLITDPEDLAQLEWRKYIRELQREKNLPGIEEIGFVSQLSSLDKEKHLRMIRKQGLPQYDIQPPGERLRYSPVLFYEALGSLQHPHFGYDMFADDTLRQAMEIAQKNDSAAITAKITPAQNGFGEIRTSFFMYIPVFDRGVLNNSDDKGSSNLLGHVYARLFIDDFIEGTSFEKDGYVDLSIFDGDAANPQSLMYASRSGNTFPAGPTPHHYVSKETILEYASHRWFLVFDCSVVYEDIIAIGPVDFVFMLGGIVLVFMYGAASSLIRYHYQTSALAEKSLDLEHLNTKLVEKIDEHKQMMLKLQENEEFVRRMVECSNDCIKVLDFDGNLLSMSEGGQKLMEIDDITPYLNTKWIDLWQNEHKEAALEALSKVRSEGSASFRGYMPTFKGTPKWWENTIVQITDHAGHADRLLVVSKDITNSRHLEDLQAFLAQTSAGMYSTTFFEKLAIYLSKSLKMDLISISRLVDNNLAARTVAICKNGRLEKMMTYVLKDTPCGEAVGKTVICFPADVQELFPKDHLLKELQAESYTAVSLFNHHGQPIGLISVIDRKPLANEQAIKNFLQMVTGRTAGELELLDHEAALQTSLAEKEVLLQEVHHRVKNNLAAIIGLVELQGQSGRTTNGTTTKSSLAELSGRIRSMALVHEQLYQSGDFSRINFQGYLESLVGHLRTSYGRSTDTHITVDADGVEMGLDLAVPCGLFITELVTNSMKYAFPTGKPRPGASCCEIRVSANYSAPVYSLRVADNGVGLPTDKDWNNTGSLGMVLIGMLGRQQLQGDIDVDLSDGTAFTLKFCSQRESKGNIE